MKVAKLEKPETFLLETRERPVLEAGEVIVRVAEVGICGSDLKMYRGLHPVLKPPMVLGHEVLGTVEEASGIPFKRGDVVMVFPPVGDGTCRSCLRGDPHLCDAMEVIGAQRPGGLAEYVRVPEGNLFAVPPDVPDALRILIEPLAVGVHAADRARASAEDECLVIGAGPVGLFTALALQHSGASRVVITDIKQSRLNLAAELGLETIRALDDAVAYKTALNRPDGLDVFMECVGSNDAVDLGLGVTRRGGRVVLVGVEPERLILDGPAMQRQERSVIGVQMYRRDDFMTAARLLTNGLIPPTTKPEQLFRVFPLSETAEAFRQMLTGQIDALKVVISHGHSATVAG
ncbi:zinc-binding dehydrogenase [Arthrobacter sp. NA-172]|uniref:zinc-dependent alcohol dehydrogenase n=1 Tax=Arthrobacter sp. NA-172 TaxID=3367524 RepID=UPI00375493E4